MRNNQNKAITKEDLGNMLHKYINPLYKRMDKFEIDIDKVIRIQLRMESKLDDHIKIFYDKDSAHDNKLVDHEKRISFLERSR